MFLKFFSLKKTFFTSSATRSSYHYYNKFLDQKKFSKLSIYKKWKSGRASNGKIILWTRSSLLQKNKSIKVNYNLRYNYFGFISTFQFIPFRNKLLTLVFFSTGAVSYYLTSENQKIFSYFFYNLKKKIKKFKLKIYRLMLCQIKKLSKVSLIEIYPGLSAQYCRSAGSFGKIIKFDTTLKNALITLPSGVKKLFSHYSFAFTTKMALSSSFKLTSTKSGYWRKFGIKPIVRGVAMNPVDHPHGGRTKSVRYQRTPWGKTTKLK